MPAQKRVSNQQLHNDVRLLLARVESMLYVLGGLAGSISQQPRGQYGAAPMDPNVQELLRTLREPPAPFPGTGPGPLRMVPTKQERDRQIAKAKEEAEKLKEKIDQEIQMTLDKRAEKGIPDDGNAVLPADLDHLDD